MRLAEFRRTWTLTRRRRARGVRIFMSIWRVYEHLADVLVLDARVVVRRFGRLTDGPGPDIHSCIGRFSMDLGT